MQHLIYKNGNRSGKGMFKMEST